MSIQSELIRKISGIRGLLVQEIAYNNNKKRMRMNYEQKIKQIFIRGW